MMVRLPNGKLVSQDESERLFMYLIEDDPVESVRLAPDGLHFSASSDLFGCLRAHARRRKLPWFTTGMTPILYTWPGFEHKRQVVPDLFVAVAPDRPRESFDAGLEGGFPVFVLEIVTPAGSDRGQFENPVAYDVLGAQEYALFNPLVDRPSELFGYRRSASGTFEPWPSDDQGRLWSDLLGLYLVSEGTTIRATTRDGELLRTPAESEEEIDHLRREIEELRRQTKGE